MIFYGYAIDFEIAKWDRLKEVEEACEKAGIELRTGYSVGAYSPTYAGIGITLDDTDCLFYPVRLDKCRLEPTQEEIDKVAQFDIEPWKEFLEHSDPGVMMYTDTDD